LEVLSFLSGDRVLFIPGYNYEGQSCNKMALDYKQIRTILYNPDIHYFYLFHRLMLAPLRKLFLKSDARTCIDIHLKRMRLFDPKFKLLGLIFQVQQLHLNTF